MKKQITISEWLELSIDKRKKYSRDCWNPKLYNKIGTAEEYLREERKVKRNNKIATYEHYDVSLR